MEPLLAMYYILRTVLDHWGIFTARVHTFQCLTSGQAGREKVSSLLKEVSPDSSSKTIHDNLKEDAIMNVLTHEDGAMIHYLLSKVQFNIGNNSNISQMHKPENPGKYMTIFAAPNHPFSR
jgi:hypothetical protein